MLLISCSDPRPSCVSAVWQERVVYPQTLLQSIGKVLTARHIRHVAVILGKFLIDRPVVTVDLTGVKRKGMGASPQWKTYDAKFLQTMHLLLSANPVDTVR
jgi:hypothetical protein